MKHFFIRSHIVFMSLILLATMSMTMALVMKFNQRWDWTKEKIYSLSEPTAELLHELRDGIMQVSAFYPQDDPALLDFDIFLKEVEMHHPHFKYRFYDPDRAPRIAKEMRVKDIYTVIIEYGGRQERIIRPTEESFTNALLRLARPVAVDVCFVAGHGEASLDAEDRGGYSLFKQSLEDNNYTVHQVLLSRDPVAKACDIVLIAGPHQDLDQGERVKLREFLEGGLGILFLIDPMDPGTGKSFKDFMRDHGIFLGSDVIVDKMSRMVGGDFLVPLVSQYVSQHPITEKFDVATFFPVARSVQPSSDKLEDLIVTPLAFSGSGSWSETNLGGLEKGEAAFEAETDLSGPISIAVAVEQANVAAPGRMVVIGDSDFLTNAYLELSGNKDFALNAIQWLAKDDRFIAIRPRQQKFVPLLMDSRQRLIMLCCALGGLPLLFLVLGGARLIWRMRTS